MKKALKIIIWLIILAVIIIGFLVYLHHRKIYPSTDDAYIRAHIVHISPQVSGPVDHIYVQNYQHVKKGQLLLTIDPRPFEIAVQSAQAKASLAESNKDRIMKLVSVKQASIQQGDTVTSNAKAAEAALNKAKLDLSYTKIYAPESGILVNFKVRPGNMISAGQKLFDIVENNIWWVNANFKETDLDRIRTGQLATVTTDMYPDHPFKGRVYKISPGSGAAFSLLPPENATGNWVKVTQRFPVKVLISDPSDDFPLRVGASANITINTESK